jgi:hypothetical protein
MIVKRGLNLAPVTNKWTAKSFLDTWRRLEADLNGQRGLARSLPATVPPIDWDSYRAKIKEPGVVDKIKAEYEAKKFTSAAIPFEETDKTIEKMDRWYTTLHNLSLKKITMLEAKREEHHEEKSTVGFWGTSDVFHRYPGLQEQLELRESRHRIKTRYTPETRIAVFDWTEARKALKEGRKPEGLPPPLKSVGDFNREEWDAREARELEWLEQEYIRCTSDDAPKTDTKAIAAAPPPAPAPATVPAKH